MSFSSDKKHKLIFENWRGFVSEKADPTAIDKDKFPTRLSQVNPDVAKAITRTGAMDGNAEDDKIPVKANALFPVSQLKPSQSSMNISKAMAQALAMLMGTMPAGGDLGAFISNDGHIMDGHHRWVATAMVDPSKEVGGYLVDFPGSELIAILNAITVGRLGKAPTDGKAGTGGFNQFKIGPITQQLVEYYKNGIPGDYPVSAEDIQKLVHENTGLKGEQAIKALANKFAMNLADLRFEVPTGAPARPDMPVIDGDSATSLAATALNTGEIDVNPPYGKIGQK
tara:strand:+ start:4012 stop:4860 length:849 start_codon:yes stop_codon:yes gene_type:complete